MLNSTSVGIFFHWKERYQDTTIIVDNAQNFDFVDELIPILQQDSKTITRIDVRTLVSKRDLQNVLVAIPDGFLVLEHVTEVPVGKDQEMIQEYIRWILKGDWRNNDVNVHFISEWENHMAQSKLQIYAIVANGDIHNRVFPQSACLWVAYGECKDSDILRLDKEA